MAVNLQLVPATAGKRLGAAVMDWLPPLAVLVITFALGFAGITRTRSGGFIIYDTASLVLFGGIGLGLTLVYLFVVMAWEARTGKTLGNLLMGIRTADNDGYAPGAGPVFLRGLITGAGILLTLLVAVLVVVFQWFGAAVFVLGPLVLVGAAWAVLVVVSNSWDKNGRLRGWHDAAAKTLAFDVKSGRDPITTGGIQGPYSFAPLDLPPVQQVLSPVAGAAPVLPPPAVARRTLPEPQVAPYQAPGPQAPAVEARASEAPAFRGACIPCPRTGRPATASGRRRGPHPGAPGISRTRARRGPAHQAGRRPRLPAGPQRAGWPEPGGQGGRTAGPAARRRRRRTVHFQNPSALAD
jgi:uncharacterized RDD family membrane protein YckC